MADANSNIDLAGMLCLQYGADATRWHTASLCSEAPQILHPS